MRGGQCYAIKRIPPNNEYPDFSACVEENNIASQGLQEEVAVEGQWIGIDCGYSRTIFDNCMPDIQALSITNI